MFGSLSCRVARHTCIIPSSSRLEAADTPSIDFTRQWTNALTATLCKGIETAKQSQMEQQHLPAWRSKHGSSAHSFAPSCAGALGIRCCQTWGKAVVCPEKHVQQMTRAERLSLLTVKAHEYTVQYEQVINLCLVKACLPCMQTLPAVCLKPCQTPSARPCLIATLE